MKWWVISEPISLHLNKVKERKYFLGHGERKTKARILRLRN
jgi:hypothetical protein